jgi:hypothetical protein
VTNTRTNLLTRTDDYNEVNNYCAQTARATRAKQREDTTNNDDGARDTRDHVRNCARKADEYAMRRGEVRRRTAATALNVHATGRAERGELGLRGMGTSSLRAGTRRGRAGSARRGIGLAACCDSRRQGIQSRAKEPGCKTRSAMRCGQGSSSERTNAQNDMRPGLQEAEGKVASAQDRLAGGAGDHRRRMRPSARCAGGRKEEKGSPAGWSSGDVRRFWTGDAQRRCCTGGLRGQRAPANDTAGRGEVPTADRRGEAAMGEKTGRRVFGEDVQ